MKITELLNEAPKKTNNKDDSWVKKADDAVRGSFPMKAIQTMQGTIGRPGPAEIKTKKTKDVVKKKKNNKATTYKKPVQSRNDKINPNNIPTTSGFVDKRTEVGYEYEKDRDLWIPKKNGEQPLSGREGAMRYNKTDSDKRYYVKETIILEGGNIFKKVEGEKVIPLTQRIATVDVQPTIDWINATFGFKFVDEDMLGTTGKKTKEDGTFEENSSGDLDLNVDARELPKEEIIAKLTAWCQKQGIDDLEIMNKGRTFTQGWVANAGVQVHFKTPIRGDVKNGFVQTDFMLTDNPDFQRGSKRGGTENYTGADRAVLLSSLARGRGYKFSPSKGIVDPNNGDTVVAANWDEIAKILLGPNAREPDTHTVESMLAKLKSDPDYEKLIAPWKESMAKAGKEVPEGSNEIIDMAHRMIR